MQHRFLTTVTARVSAFGTSLRRRRFTRPHPRVLARRFAVFWLVWTALLLVHEAGHALVGRRQGLDVRQVTVGAGPVLWRGEADDTELVLRLVPLAGVTRLGDPEAEPHEGHAHDAHGAIADWSAWARHTMTLAGGVVATLLLAVAVAGVVAVRERRTGVRWVLGRILVADAVVLTVFNFLPVPPLDGGRAVVGAIAAWRGAPLADDTLFWVHLGGLALAVVPMALWTRWTARIDRVVMRWGAPDRDQ